MTASTLSRADLDRCIVLRETISDFILADALDGKIREAEWTAMHAAFVTSDTLALVKLAAGLHRDTDFVEPSAVLKTLTRKARQALTDVTYITLLRETPGTRLYARAILDSNIQETPFD